MKIVKYMNRFAAIAAPMLCIASLFDGLWLNAACMAMIALSSIIDWNRYD